MASSNPFETAQMSEGNSLLVGYTPAVMALCGVLAYFLLLRFVFLKPDPPSASVVTYEPPVGISPAMAAWLVERSLDRALAAALVNMAAKRFLVIEQADDDLSITKLKDASFDCLEPEEDALAFRLFDTDDCFDFEEPTRLSGPLERFEHALNNRTYFSSNFLPSLPAWIVSIAASVYALFEGIDVSHLSGNGVSLLLLSALLICCMYAVGLGTMGGAIEKIAGRMAGRGVQRRPWNGIDAVAIICLSLTAAAVFALSSIASLSCVLILAAFLLLNAVFYQLLHAPNAEGKKLLDQALAYREFLGAVDADALARARSSDRVPANFGAKDAYAIALHLDLGWGESFVTSIDAAIDAMRSEEYSGGRAAYQVYRDLR
jgi:Predicted membrane protein (DUF2207)